MSEKYDTSTIKNRISSLCDKNKIDEKKAMVESGAGRNAFDNIKNGKVPSVMKIEQIADYFGVSVDYLLGREKIIAPIKTNWSNLTEILNQLTEQEIDSMIDYAEFLLSKRQVPVQPKD